MLAPLASDVVYSVPMSSPSGRFEPLAKPYRIVAVDDHPIILSGVELLLQHEPDFTWLGSAATPDAAAELVARTRPDAVVLDLRLGGNDGVEMVRRLHALAPASALLCYTMNEESLFGMQSLRAGAAGFLSKQEPLDELLAALRVVCTGGRVLSRKLQRTLFDGHPLPENNTAAELARLTDRELQVLRLIGLAKSNHEIAAELDLSVKTVSAHRESLKAKLKLATSPELTRYAVLLVEQNAFGQ